MADTHRPNPYGFGGGGTGPDVHPSEESEEKRRAAEEAEAEREAVPGDDLSTAVTEGLADATGQEDEAPESSGTDRS